MSLDVYHIHSQADAKVELERRRLMARARHARRRQRTQESSVYQTQIRISWAENKGNSRARKRKAVNDCLSDVEARSDADRKARMRKHK